MAGAVLDRRVRVAGITAGLVLAIAAIGYASWAMAADHRDSLSLTSDAKADIADVYTFVSPSNQDNLVLVMTLDGLIPPSETGEHFFDPDVLHQFKIDRNGDAIEDLVIQARAFGNGRGQVMRFRGPATPSLRGVEATVLPAPDVGRVRVSARREAIVSEQNGIRVFAGLRDDPFFFDLAQFIAIVNGQASSFRSPGVDAFAGTNILAIAVELPIALLGGTNVSVWGTTSRPVSGS